MRHLFGRWMLLLPAAAAAPAAPLSAEQQQAAAKQRPVQIWGGFMLASPLKPL
ncbi:hypothetical protein SEVIR_5G233532v4 [Setaria viridis]|uniref:Uncharacterized protein n=1 Tax=Setaria viridis TaxID=4556 RepID=A0A4U6UH80_SETVI|nr:hypothetical protein SEVIR_5G233532v2 [Setaria viridis]